MLFACVSSIAESQQDISSGLELLRSRKGHSVVLRFKKSNGTADGNCTFN
ncbi:hypothetical protein B4113_3049 [Geobacillus sp. B4113_201601]|nr:hypothetical protein B4113_3049 [Geobacillus sp. B4113_201601]